jgi:mycothiol S-conjugate amidase
VVTRDGETLRLMAVHAHPDDESSKGAATMAKYVAEGADVLVVTMTGGERGDILNPALAHDEELANNLPAVRRTEMAEAAQALGVRHAWCGFVDSGLPEGDPLPPLPEGSFATLDPLAAAIPLAEAIRDFRPHVLVTYDPSGGYPHPDHIMTHTVSMAAVAEAADAGTDLGGRPPWATPKVYYHRGFSVERSIALHEAMTAAGLDSPFLAWIEAHAGQLHRSAPVTARVDASACFPQRDAALRAHATQVDPEGFFFAVPRDLEARAWPWEEYELARTAPGVSPVIVPPGAVETDLFAGLRAGAEG